MDNTAKQNTIDATRKVDAVVLNTEFKTKNELYSAYMPFVKDGAMFIGTPKIFQLGDRVFINLKLMEEIETYLVEGKVVWITPRGAQGGMPAGIGVQFISENAQLVRNKIETHLVGMRNSDSKTDTM